MGNNDDSISRRKFLEQASVAVGAVALGNACGSDETAPEQPAGEAGASGQPRAAGSMSQAGSGTAAGRGGSPSTGTAGSRADSGAAAAGAGGRPMAAAGSGGSGTAAAGSGAAGMPSGAAGMAANPSGKVTVGIVSKASIDEAVALVVELAGGINEIQPGQTVFIKPNAVSDRAIGMPGIRTANDILAAVIKLVKAKNPGRIIVGDRSARLFPDTARVFAMSGMGEAAMMAGADEVYAAKSPLEAPEEWVMLKPPMFEVSWQAAGGMYAMRKILDADHLINVPTCKNHQYALYSLSMKNFMGAIGDSTRDPVHFRDSTGGNFGPMGRDLAIINQMFKPLINIIDARTALINGGPGGDSANSVRTSPGLVFASKDRLAIDAAVVSMMQLELENNQVSMPDASNGQLKSTKAWQMPQIMHGIERGIGVGGADMVELAFDSVMTKDAIEAKFRA